MCSVCAIAVGLFVLAARAAARRRARRQRVENVALRLTGGRDAHYRQRLSGPWPVLRYVDRPVRVLELRGSNVLVRKHGVECVVPASKLIWASEKAA